MPIRKKSGNLLKAPRILEKDKKRWCIKYNLLLFFSFYYLKSMYGSSEKGSKMADLVHTHTHTHTEDPTVPISCEPLPLLSPLSWYWYRATAMHRIFIVSHCFSTFASLVLGHLKELKHFSLPSLLYSRESRTEPA